jgi:hypothetical protein
VRVIDCAPASPIGLLGQLAGALPATGRPPSKAQSSASQARARAMR